MTIRVLRAVSRWPAGAMGRLFFPGLPALALLSFYGLGQLLTGAARAARTSVEIRVGIPRLLALLANGGMLALALVALLGYLAPAYARPPGYPADMQIPNPVHVQFSGLATLRGYELSRETLQPGEPLRVDLFWEVDAAPPANFLLFLHLIDSTGALVAQRDTHPGTGTFPTGQWQAGDRFVDSLSVYVPETAYTPETVTVKVGFYAPTYRLAITGPDGEALGDSLTLGVVHLRPAAEHNPPGEDLPNPMDQNFQNEIYLRGYEYNERLLQAGETLEATLYWERAGKIEREYVVRLQLLDNGEVLAETQQGLAPPQWEPEVIRSDGITLPLPGDLAPGAYVVRLILYDPVRDEAHHLVAPEGHFSGEHLDLARVLLPGTSEVPGT